MPLAEFLTLELLYAAVAALVGGLVLGFSGFGAALIMTPAFTLLWEASVAVPTCLTLLVVANAQLFLPALRACEPKTTSIMALAACLTIPLGSYALLAIDRDTMQRAIGAVVLLLVTVLALGFRYRGPRTPLVTSGVGILSGVLNGSTGMGGPPVIFYLLSGPDSAARNRANLLAFYSVVNTVSLVALTIAGLLTWVILIRALLVVPFYAFGIWSGTRLFSLSDEKTYRRGAFALLFAVAAVTLLA